MASKEMFNCKYNLDYEIVDTMYIFQAFKDDVWRDIDLQRGCEEKAFKKSRYLRNRLRLPIRIIQVKETTIQTSDYELLGVIGL